MDKDAVLEEIFKNDPLGLLDVIPKKSNAKSADERLVASFEEINGFMEKNGRLPEPNTSSVSEFQLYSRFKAIDEDPMKTLQLKEYDRHKILKDVLEDSQDDRNATSEQKEINTIYDIFSEDFDNLLSVDSIDIHTLKHVPKQDRSETDFVAMRKKCKDFNKYEDEFKNVQKELSEGTRKLLPFNEKDLEEGNYFVHNGILLFLEKTINLTKDNNGKVDGRTRVIFENGTESNMKFRSLGKNLFDNGQSVSKSKATSEEDFLTGFNAISKEDSEVGYIYVLKSKSKDPKIAFMENLYKIGYSTTDVATRIRNAEKEPTYLMAPVENIATWKCFNLNPQKFEKLIHQFFGSSRLQLEIIDSKGEKHTPKEWFIVPLQEINQAIDLIISGEIISYQYDSRGNMIVNR
ncbi:MAG: GIY-YIG nuclease family protein [Leptospiraceae bacterium]|nr:GIY-YIG nuclease family protein [Leptospiraceae bacterium]